MIKRPDFLYLLRSGLGIPDYWHPYLEVQNDFQAGKVGTYPVSMAVKADYPGQINEEGVPVVYLEGRATVLPVTVILFGLGSHDAFLTTGDKRYQQQMMQVLSWLKRHCVGLGYGVGWPNHMDIPLYGLKDPWFSALTSALALSLFVRADQLHPEEQWAAFARKTWLGFDVPLQHGGFCRNIGTGAIYEEYPRRSLDCAFSGMCLALIGLWESLRSGVVPEAERSFNEGLAGLRSLLPRFAYGRWSLYSLNDSFGTPLLASPYYQRSNGLLAQVVGIMAGDSEFRSYGERWVSASDSRFGRIALSLRIALHRYRHAPALLHSDKATNH
jgi:hypothetical protein